MARRGDAGGHRGVSPFELISEASRRLPVWRTVLLALPPLRAAVERDLADFVEK
jgi:hypothetical protein